MILFCDGLIPVLPELLLLGTKLGAEVAVITLEVVTATTALVVMTEAKVLVPLVTRIVLVSGSVALVTETTVVWKTVPGTIDEAAAELWTVEVSCEVVGGATADVLVGTCDSVVTGVDPSVNVACVDFAWVVVGSGVEVDIAENIDVELGAGAVVVGAELSSAVDAGLEEAAAELADAPVPNGTSCRRCISNSAADVEESTASSAKDRDAITGVRTMMQNDD